MDEVRERGTVAGVISLSINADINFIESDFKTHPPIF